FQAEDGIRVFHVTGVQTCALPISQVKTVDTRSERFEIPKVSGKIEGNNTVITNISQIASYIRRPVENIAKFLQKELATPGSIEKIGRASCREREYRTVYLVSL